LTTVTEARLALRAVMENGNIVDAANNPVPLRWQNEPAPDLPDEPAPWVFTQFLTESGMFVEHGRGRGHNRFRNFARAVSWCFVPQDTGLDQAEMIANQIANLLRSYKDAAITCEQADVFSGDSLPSIGSADVGNYASAACETILFFDLVG
jgi:hypothetical protein